MVPCKHPSISFKPNVLAIDLFYFILICFKLVRRLGKFLFVCGFLKVPVAPFLFGRILTKSKLMFF